MLRAMGIADEQGRVKPSRQAKYRQVEEFLRALGAAVDDATAAGALRTPTAEEPLQVVDLGCGNAYLTFAAHRYLSQVRGLPTRVVGIDVKAQSLEHNTDVARSLGLAGEARFLQAPIGDVGLDRLGVRPDVVLALHACDTATDDALAQAVRWQAPLVLAAPCCHHDVAAQLKARLKDDGAPTPYSVLVRDGILRERFADTLTDALRAGRCVWRATASTSSSSSRAGTRPATRCCAPCGPVRRPTAEARAELDQLTRTWGVRPALQELLA